MIAAIPFTQYIRPRGRKKSLLIVRPAMILHKAEAIINSGYRFEIEELSTGMISMTIVGFDPSTGEEGDVAHKLTRNDKSVPSKVDDLVMSFVIPRVSQVHASRKR